MGTVTRYLEKLVLGLTNASPGWRSGAGNPNGVVGGIVGDGWLSTNGNFYRCTVAHATAATWVVASASSSGTVDIWPQAALLTAPDFTGWTSVGTPIQAPSLGPVSGIKLTAVATAGDTTNGYFVSASGTTHARGRLRWLTSKYNYPGGGLTLRESATGKQLVVGIQGQAAAAAPWLACTNWTDDTHQGAVLGVNIMTIDPYIPWWVDLEYSTANVVVTASRDGYNFDVLIGSFLKTTYFTVAPNQVGWKVNPALGAAGVAYGMAIESSLFT